VFTLKQLDGTDAHPALLKLAGAGAVREFALRALTDRSAERDGLDAKPFVAALADKSPRVQAQALNSRGGIESRPEAIPREPLGKDAERVYPSGNHHKNWTDCVKSGRECIGPAEVGHRSATVCHLGNIAVRSGRKVTWDPVKEEITGDAEAAKMVTKAYRAPWKLPV
jgi:GFO/IDH/MocA oxidoreductase family protein